MGLLELNARTTVVEGPLGGAVYCKLVVEEGASMLDSPLERLDTEIVFDAVTMVVGDGSVVRSIELFVVTSPAELDVRLCNTFSVETDVTDVVFVSAINSDETPGATDTALEIDEDKIEELIIANTTDVEIVFKDEARPVFRLEAGLIAALGMVL